MGMIRHTGATMRFQPRIRKGAFFEAAWRHGCRTFSVYNRTYISSTFSNPLDEYWSVTNDVAIWPVMGERQVEIGGPDAAAFVDYLTSRNMEKCTVGQCKYALICAPDGGIVSDPIILKLAEDRFWLSTSDCDLELWAKGVLVNAPFNVAIRDANVSVIQVQGPKSPYVIANLFGDDLLDLKYYRLASAPFHGKDLIISRTGWSGEFGYEIYLLDETQGSDLFDALIEVGRAVNAMPGAVNHVRRIESGILSWGVDMSASDNPFEMGLGRLVELDSEHDFVGRAALERAKDRPLGKTLVGVVIEGDALAPNEDVWRMSLGDKAVGAVTSVAHSPRLKANIAIGRIVPELAATGTAIAVDSWDGVRHAKVTDMPFVPKRQGGSARALFAKAVA